MGAGLGLSSDDQLAAAATPGGDAGLGDLEPLTDAAAAAGIGGKDFLGAPDAAAATDFAAAATDFGDERDDDELILPSNNLVPASPLSF